MRVEERIKAWKGRREGEKMWREAGRYRDEGGRGEKRDYVDSLFSNSQ